MTSDIRRWMQLVESANPEYYYIFVKDGVSKVLPDDTSDIFAIENDGWELVWDSARTMDAGYAFALKNHHAYPEGEKPPALIDTPGFKKWFGQSKCVDKKGRPLRVYHGTFKPFDAFTYAKPNGAGSAGFGFNRIGFWFDSDPRTPNSFADGGGGNIQPVYLSMQNPLVLENEPVSPKALEAVRKASELYFPLLRQVREPNDHGRLDDLRYKAEKAYEKARDAVLTAQDPFEQMMSRLPKYDKDGSAEHRRNHTATVAEAQAALIAEGYDGIILRNTLADAGSRGWSLTDWWIVFRPNQIKSAVSNTGNFDPNDDRLSEEITT